MHWFDSTILVLLLISAVFGAWSGLLMQVFRMVGFGLASYATMTLHDWAADKLHTWCMADAEPQVCHVVAYGVVFVAVFSLIFGVTLLIKRVIQVAKLQFYNRLLGALLAMGKMTLLLGLICFGLQSLPFDETRQLVDASTAAPYLARGMGHIVHTLPEDYKPAVPKDWQKHMVGKLQV